MSDGSALDADVAARARAWHHAAQDAVCDVIEPWAHGTVVRATRYEGPAPSGPAITVEQVPHDAVDHLRLAWHGEDSPGHDIRDHLVHAHEVARLRGAEVLAVLENGTPVAFARDRGALLVGKGGPMAAAVALAG